MRRIIHTLFLATSLTFSVSAFADCEKCHEKAAKKGGKVAECCQKGKKHGECKDCAEGKCEECCKDGQCKHEKHAHHDHAKHAPAKTADSASQ